MTEKKKRKIQQKIGQLFQIPLSSNRFGYCQMVSEGFHMFFECFDDGNNPDIEKILNSKALFCIGVSSYIFKDGVWSLLGCFNVKKDYKRQDLFSYDRLKKTYIIWRVVDGILQKIPSTPEEIQNLECFASSDERHVIERLEDHLAGRPNYWIELDKNQHDPNFPGITEFYKKYGYDYKLDKN